MSLSADLKDLATRQADELTKEMRKNPTWLGQSKPELSLLWLLALEAEKLEKELHQCKLRLMRS